MHPEVTVVIPTYNEGKIIIDTIKKIESVLNETRLPYEIIISDDGSKDETVKIVEGLIKSDKNVRIVAYKTNRGYGEAISDGFCNSRGKILIHIDADLSTNVSHLKDLIHFIKSGYDIAIGSRYVEGAVINRARFRRMTSFLYRLFVKTVLNIKAKDHATGFKGYKRDVALDLIKEMNTLASNIRGIAWGTEIVCRAERRGYKIKEFPVSWVEGWKSEINVIKEGFKTIKYILGLRFRLQ